MLTLQIAGQDPFSCTRGDQPWSKIVPSATRMAAASVNDTND